jgi:hypothetical protein
LVLVVRFKIKKLYRFQKVSHVVLVVNEKTQLILLSRFRPFFLTNVHVTPLKMVTLVLVAKYFTQLGPSHIAHILYIYIYIYIVKEEEEKILKKEEEKNQGVDQPTPNNSNHRKFQKENFNFFF